MPAYSSSATFTPAAASHVANDVVGGAKEFKGLAGATGSAIQIASASLLVNSATIETTAWRVYLYNVTPPSAIADDGPWDLGAGDQAAFLGYVDIAQLVDLGSSLYIQSDNLNKQIKMSGRSVFGYLVNLTTLTPAAVSHIVTLHAVVPY
jgi:hypothetical protein